MENNMNPNNGQFNQNSGQFNANNDQFNQNNGQFNANNGQFNQNNGQFGGNGFNQYRAPIKKKRNCSLHHFQLANMRNLWHLLDDRAQR